MIKTDGIKKKKRPAPFPLRLSEEERSLLLNRAGNLALGAYIKAQLFDAGVARRPKTQQRVIKADQKLLAQILAVVASSRLRERLEEIAELGRNGGLAFDPDAPRRLLQACEDVQAIRFLLMRALGFQVPDAEASGSVSQPFIRAALQDDNQVSL